MAFVSILVGSGFVPNFQNQIEAIFKMSVLVCLHNYLKLFSINFKYLQYFKTTNREMTAISK